MPRNLIDKLRETPTEYPVRQPEFAINPEIEAKIAAFRQANPKYVEYLRQLPRERVENIAVLRKIEQTEQKERLRQAVFAKLTPWLEQHPAVAREIEIKLKQLSPERLLAAKLRLIRAAIRSAPAAKPS